MLVKLNSGYDDIIVTILRLKWTVSFESWGLCFYIEHTKLKKKTFDKTQSTLGETNGVVSHITVVLINRKKLKDIKDYSFPTSMFRLRVSRGINFHNVVELGECKKADIQFGSFFFYTDSTNLYIILDDSKPNGVWTNFIYYLWKRLAWRQITPKGFSKATTRFLKWI